MKLYPLLLGRTKVPYGQFYGGLSGWERLGALLRFILDEDEYAREPNETLARQLKRLGYRCDDVRTVILTHLHEDHAGRVRDLSRAKVVFAKAEWDARRTKMFGFVPMFYEPSLASAKQWELVPFESGAFHSFDRSQDLFGDQSVRLLPTPGHTPGHACALIEMGGYQLLIAGDCRYALRHLATGQLQAFRLSKDTGDQQVESIRRIAGLRKLMPGLHLAIGHDHTEYQSKYLMPYLSKGWLSGNERRAISE